MGMLSGLFLMGMISGLFLMGMIGLMSTEEITNVRFVFNGNDIRFFLMGLIGLVSTEEIMNTRLLICEFKPLQITKFDIQSPSLFA